ncbi:hypothetical protein ANCCAN_05627 [Ancylostoma caninum]|uniref:SCP domain-containing protein n=1 Tax=Ancylostoma caninum TaxID=29170 RepID=A0A368GXN4_ANCCA|nr:hypothetical protein ANCCAN_05627 [Ancylostoma caninum]
MKALVLLTAITCTAQPWSIFSSFFGGYWTRYPFLRSACWEARKAYSSIINDPHMSRGERENALNNWADQYGLTTLSAKYG